MFAFITGRIVELTESTVTLENQGMGYELIAGAFTLSKLEVGATATLQTHLAVREDGVSLLGFFDPQEKQLFLRLISVSGVGPKLAFTALSALPTAELARAIATADVNLLSRIKGLGKKTAERIILELQDKTDVHALGAAAGKPRGGAATAETVDALVSLGFARSQAQKAVDTVYLDGMTIEQLFTKALRTFSK
ncbi:MAG: Holliday junction branch migration protein RuvA [Clostridiales bacterium]|jgi:Holliday junction DNA helicase RuvA|nr:Holliday junction branch migration protein RuvA [Clostridiales bacterium]